MLKKTTIDFFKYFAKAYPGRSAAMVLLLILAGLAEGVGVVTLLPLLDTVEGGESQSRVAGAIRGLLSFVGISPSLGSFLCLIVVATLLSSALLWFAMRQVGYTVSHVSAELRLSLLEKLMRARWSYFVDRRKGEVANAISLEAARASTSYREACSFLAAIFETATYAILALLISWPITVFAFFAGTGLAFLLRRFMEMSRSAGDDQTRLIKSLSARLVDALNGMKSIRAMGREQHLLPLMRKEIEGLHKAEQRQVIASQTLIFFQQPAAAAFLAVGLYALFTISGETVSTVLVLAFLFNRLMGKANSLQQRYQGVTFGESAFWSLINQIEAAEAVSEVYNTGAKTPRLSKELTLKDVAFSYGERKILDGVNLRIAAGEFVAIVGASGTGKTTIADLIVGLHQPTEGIVLVDGVPLGSLDVHAWRGRIGYVPQEPLLFNDTILRNVTLGDESLSREQVIEALKRADAWSFISQRPEGLDEPIGEGGSRLSGGQRQRIAIARALVSNPDLLVLDEATTALDPSTEAAICATLRKLRGKVTIVAISHQPALQAAADTVYKLEAGHVTLVERSFPAVVGG